jgi:hypothetical protein
MRALVFAALSLSTRRTAPPVSSARASPRLSPRLLVKPPCRSDPLMDGVVLREKIRLEVSRKSNSPCADWICPSRSSMARRSRRRSGLPAIARSSACTRVSGSSAATAVAGAAARRRRRRKLRMIAMIPCRRSRRGRRAALAE